VTTVGHASNGVALAVETPQHDGGNGSIAAPVFVLATPRSMSSVACAMLGQHPQMYGLPETQVFREETLSEWLHCCRAFRRANETSASEPFMGDGLLRAVAEICYGGQSAATVNSAAGWLRRRSTHTPGMVFEELARKVYPLHLVDKSPNMVYSAEKMRRVRRFFPEARFVHLVRHPRAYCASVMTYMDTLARLLRMSTAPRWITDLRMNTAPGWITDLASFPYPPGGGAPEHPERPDPQGGWYVLNTNVTTFLDSLPDNHWIRVRAEDLVRDPARVVSEVATWLGLRSDAESIARTLHPELSPFACIGPPGARYGNDLFFLQQPALRPARGRSQNLDDPLEWRPDGQGFLPEVEQLAREFGYN
jgi:hypothetical protein